MGLCGPHHSAVGVTPWDEIRRSDPTYFIANLRLILDVEVQAGNQTASQYRAPGLWELLTRLPRPH